VLRDPDGGLGGKALRTPPRGNNDTGP